MPNWYGTRFAPCAVLHHIFQLRRSISTANNVLPCHILLINGSNYDNYLQNMLFHLSASCPTHIGNVVRSSNFDGTPCCVLRHIHGRQCYSSETLQQPSCHEDTPLHCISRQQLQFYDTSCAPLRHFEFNHWHLHTLHEHFAYFQDDYDMYIYMPFGDDARHVCPSETMPCMYVRQRPW